MGRLAKGGAASHVLMWAARLKADDRRDRIEALVREARVLRATYLEGAGIFAWQKRADLAGYEAVGLPTGAQVGSLDDIIDEVAQTIRRLAPRGGAPDPHKPAHRVPGVGEIAREPATEG